MMKTRISLKRNCALLIALIIFATVFAHPITAQAATGFKALKYGSENVVSAGSYYFQMYNGNVFYSTEKNGNYTGMGFSSVYSAFTDGETVYVVDTKSSTTAKLIRYTISDGKKKTLKGLAYGDYYEETPKWTITTIYGNAIFLSKSNYEDMTVRTYVYNTSTGSLKLKKSNCDIKYRSSKYLIGKNAIQANDDASKWSLYSTNSNGDLSLLKTFGKYVGKAQFVDGKILFAKYSNYDMNQVIIYRCEKDGTSTKSLGSITFGNGYQDSIYILAFKSTYCKLRHKNDTYKYTYATKKLTKL